MNVECCELLISNSRCTASREQFGQPGAGARWAGVAGAGAAGDAERDVGSPGALRGQAVLSGGGGL